MIIVIAPSTYDYLDEFCLLKPYINELYNLTKMKIDSKEDDFHKLQNKVQFLINVLLKSCKKSKVRQLPPINWYFLINSLMRSKFGEQIESQIIELTLFQINNLNSAYSLLKNYLIDTNYFLKFKVYQIV